MFTRNIKLVLAVGLIATLVASVVPTVFAAPPSAAQSGNWQAVDVDGSNLDLAIAGGGGGTYRLIWRDDFWTLCDGDPGFGRGTASVDSIDPNVLHANIDFYCSGALALSVSFDFTYDPATDTMTDTVTGVPVTWTRN